MFVIYGGMFFAFSIAQAAEISAAKAAAGREAGD